MPQPIIHSCPNAANESTKSVRTHHKRAFTLIEILVVIAIIGVLLAILLPAIEHVRHQSYITKCASNLRQIGQAMTVYAGENHNSFPRTIYVPDQPLAFGTGISATDPFTPGGVAANDVTAAAYLLLLTGKLPPEIFICPYNDETSFETDAVASPGRSNFTDYTKNLAYSLANPYPSTLAVAAGYPLKYPVGADFPIAADLNPGVHLPDSDVLSVSPGISSGQMSLGLSRNHEREGMNVLFGDGHVSWHTDPFCGASGDNLFTTADGQVQASPVNAKDTILLPTVR
jgi:prepilin-type N-terminal cleavage/methylation domain-containing protein/prepilin-type processing-associated H-X9-DG protein